MKRTVKIYKPAFLVFILLGCCLFSSCGGEKTKPHILLITIDTLRRDHLGAYGYPRETSPFIDELARKGVRYKHVITPISATSGSHASILTSLHPVTHNVISNGNFLHNKVQTIAEVLQQRGYYTIGAIAVRILSKKYNFSQGFASFSDEWREDIDFNEPSQRTAQSVNKSLFKQIDEYLKHHRGKPLFMWVHYYDPHTPYREITGITFKTKPGKTASADSINRYDQEIRYTDNHIKKLYNYLEKTGIAKKLITCITADHGEQFGEHGYSNCHADFYSETTFVPLIFQGCGIPRNKVTGEYISTMDIAPTLLGMINLSFNSPGEGSDLLKAGDKPGSHKNRNFLIIGYPDYTRSIQLLKYPYTFILNYDSHFKNLFISGANKIPGDHFKIIHKRQIKRSGGKIKFSLPPLLDLGGKYAVIRASMKKNSGMSIQIRALPGAVTAGLRVEPGIKQFNIICPAAPLSCISVDLELNDGTEIDNLGYLFVRQQELNKHFKFKRKTENAIFNRLKTPRKEKKENELFDLSLDIKMINNLTGAKKFKAVILEYKKIVNERINYYYKKKKKILKGSRQKKDLTGKEKKMLRSLGYIQ